MFVCIYLKSESIVIHHLQIPANQNSPETHIDLAKFMKMDIIFKKDMKQDIYYVFPAVDQHQPIAERSLGSIYSCRLGNSLLNTRCKKR